MFVTIQHDGWQNAVSISYLWEILPQLMQKTGVKLFVYSPFGGKTLIAKW